ncbi:MAG: RNA polymerase subunit sigma [Phycisphaerae bacterium]|nr:RNA polymerase subunit sigma [Phycisphaerae bacterium]
MSAPDPSPNPGSITSLVNTLGQTADSEREALVPRVYDVLRTIARSRAAHGRASGVPATELVHEAYVKLFGNGPVEWDSRAHFFGAAARAMQQVLIDLSRREEVRSRHGAMLAAGGDPLAPSLTWEALPQFTRAIAELEQLEPELAEIVRLRFFAGLTQEQASRACGLPLRTLQRKWKLARGWLLLRMKEKPGSPPGR